MTFKYSGNINYYSEKFISLRKRLGTKQNRQKSAYSDNVYLEGSVNITYILFKQSKIRYTIVKASLSEGLSIKVPYLNLKCYVIKHFNFWLFYILVNLEKRIYGTR